MDKGNSTEPTSVVRRVLEALQLDDPVTEVPALFAVIVITFVTLEVLVTQFTAVLASLTTSIAQTLLVAAALVLGVIGYFAGNFWDGRFFDPRYSRGGTWIDTSRRPYGCFRRERISERFWCRN